MKRAHIELIPRRVDGGFVLRYRWVARPDERVSHTVGEHTFDDSPVHYELGILPDRVELRRIILIGGEGAPLDEHGCTIHPEEVLVEQAHAAFLADPSPIAEAGAARFTDPLWPSALDEAAYIITKAREEGGWRRHLEVRNTAAQVDAAIRKMKAARVRLQASTHYTDLTYWWDPAQGTFMEDSYMSHPYGGEDRSSLGPVSEDTVRDVLLRRPYARFPDNLR